MRLTATTGEFKHTTAEMNHDERDRLSSRSLGRNSEITGTTTDQPTDASRRATTNESACRSIILYLFKQQPWGARARPPTRIFPHSVFIKPITPSSFAFS